MIKNITQKLYSDIPQEILYHYTSFKGLLGIVDSGVLWASDVRYMNDSAEMKHTADLIRAEIVSRIAGGHDNQKLLNQFMDWYPIELPTATCYSVPRSDQMVIY